MSADAVTEALGAVDFPPSASPPTIRFRPAGDDRREAWSGGRRAAGRVVIPPGSEIMLAWDNGSEPDLAALRAAAFAVPSGSAWEIDLSATLVSDEALAALTSDLPAAAGLIGLNLNHTRLTDDGIEHIVRIESLQKLGLLQTSVTARGVQRLASLPALRRLWLNHLPVDDATLAAFAGDEAGPSPAARSLEWLLLENTSVTDAGLESVAKMTGLKLLVLKDTAVTGAGVARLAGLRRLEILSLENTRVTGPGLIPLSGLTPLRELWLKGTRLSSSDTAALAEALPACRIIFD